MKWHFIVLFPLLLVLACNQQNTKETEREVKHQSREALKTAESIGREVDSRVEDAGITAAIKLKLAKDETVSATNISVETNDHVVTLKGVVATQEEAKRALEIARGTGHVRNVISLLRVSNEASKKLSEDQIRRQAEEFAADGEITAAVKLKLAEDKSVSVLRIHVETKDGVVILRGTVKSEEEASRAKLLARSVSGVKKVISHLKIES